MPIPVQQGRTLAALVERFGIKGRHLLQLDEIIVPVAIVEDVRASEIKGTGFTTTFVEVALAGESAVARFLGTANFNNLPKKIVARPAAAGEVRVIENATAVSSVLTGAVSTEGANRWNLEQPGAPARVQFGTFAATVTGGIRERHNAPANVDTEIDLTGWRVKRAQELNVQFSVNNTQVTWTVTWDVDAVQT